MNTNGSFAEEQSYEKLEFLFVYLSQSKLKPFFRSVLQSINLALHQALVLKCMYCQIVRVKGISDIF